MKCYSRFGAVLAAFAVAATMGLSACGRSEDSGAPEQGRGIAEGKATGEITMWAMGDEGNNIGEFVKGFEQENPGVKVNVTAVPWDGAHDKLATAIAGRQTPDLSLVGTTWMGEFGSTGALDPTPPSFGKAAYFPAAWESTVVKGTSYSVPWYSDTRLLYYRTDLAATAGVAPPKSWDELKTFVKALKEKAGAKWGLGIQAGGQGTWQTFMPFAWQAGADLVNGSGEFSMDSPGMAKALDYYASFFKEGLSNTDKPQSGEMEAGFAKGEIASFISGPWHRSLVEEQGGPGFADKYSVVELPKDTAPGGFAGGGNLAVFKEAKNRDAAWKFVEYLSRPDVQAKWFEVTGNVPSVRAAWQDAKLAGDAKLQTFGKQLEVAKAPPVIPTWEQVSLAIDGEIEKVTRGGTPGAEAAKAMQSKASSIGTG